MKNIKKIIVLAIVLFMVGAVNAADYKIGYVDIAKIL